jgi:delta24-sterol reductase
MAPYTLTNHADAVEALSKEVASFHKSHTPFRINHGSTNSTRVRDPNTPQLFIAHLDHIISIDVTSKTAIVEPNVPLDALLSESLKSGLMPPVVMEFPGITVGGGFSGASGESTSRKEGLFDCTIEEVEMVLGNGHAVRAVKGAENAELFDAARCSLGTLGVVTLLKVRLTEAQDSVLLSYEKKCSVKATIDRIVELCDREDTGLDFIEGLLYSRMEGVLITGRRVAAESPEVRHLSRRRFDRAIDPWFYRHAKDLPPTHSEIVPMESYLFRYDRGAFWGGETVFRYFGLPHNWLTRFIFNPITKTRAIYRAMLASGSADYAIVQDLVVPVETSEAFVDYVAEDLQIWPLWICPMRKKVEDGDIWGWPFWKDTCATNGNVCKITAGSSKQFKSELTLNIGVWGAADSDLVECYRINRRLEERLRELRGMKVPYAAAFYTEDEFWGLYDRERYEALRKRWHAEALPSIYDKIKRSEQQEKELEMKDEEPMPLSERLLWIWPLGGLFQVYRIIFG